MEILLNGGRVLASLWVKGGTGGGRARARARAN